MLNLYKEFNDLLMAKKNAFIMINDNKKYY